MLEMKLGNTSVPAQPESRDLINTPGTQPRYKKNKDHALRIRTMI